MACVLLRREQGNATTLLLNPDDLRPANEDAWTCRSSPQEWTEACISYLDTHAIPYEIVGEPRLSPRKNVRDAIRGFVRATQTVTERIRAILVSERQRVRSQIHGYICGRPPYGYEVIKGQFVIHEQRSRAVRFIFERVQAGDSLTELVTKLRKKYSAGGVVPGPQHWDRVKIKRVLSHARLYCLGEYSGGSTKQPVTLPHLIFLPTEWATVAFHNNHHKEAAP